MNNILVFVRDTMPLEAAGMSVFVEQVKYLHDVFDADLKYFIHLGFLG